MDIETALSCFEYHAARSDADGSYWSDEDDNDKHTDREAMDEVCAHIMSLEADLAATNQRLIDRTLELGTMRERREELEKAGIRACCIMESTAQIFGHGSETDLAHAITLLNESQDLRSVIDAARPDDSNGEG